MSDDLVLRSFALDDISIRSGGDGRTVEAYAAVFARDAEIVDHQGHYLERIDPAAFNRTLDHLRPQGARSNWSVGVFYNHSMTVMGTPSERFSLPLGAPVDISADGYGLRTVTRFNKTDDADRVLESIRNGDINAYSFRGRIIRSDKPVPARGFRPSRDGGLTVVTRMEMGLTEYGPTPVPAYVDAVVVGVRSTTPLGDPESDDQPEQDPAVGHSARRPAWNTFRAALIERGIK